MSAVILLDTGPLVACLIKREQHHHWATDKFHDFNCPLQTCEAVISEATHLLYRRGGSINQLNKWLRNGFIQIQSPVKDELEPVLQFMEKYADLPMSFADACLMRMAQLHQGARVFTLDQHFRVYRMGRRRVPLIIPPAK